MHKVTNHAINFYILGTDLKVLRKKKKSSTKTNFLQNKLFWKVKSHTRGKKKKSVWYLAILFLKTWILSEDAAWGEGCFMNG